MIRTLYLRIAIVIFAVVWISLAISGFIFSHYYRTQLNSRIEPLLQNASKLVIRFIQETETQQLEQTVTIAGRLNRGQDLYLYSSTGESFVSRPASLTKCPIPLDIIGQVLAGGSYSSFQDETSDNCMQGLVGTYFEYAGGKYALFVSSFAPTTPKRFELFESSNLWLIFMISTFLIAIAAVYLVRPLKQITEATRSIAGGNFNVKLNIRQRDELGVLAESITHMAEELKKTERMRQEFVSNVSHDIQTPLTSIRGFSKLLQQPHVNGEDRQTYLKLIESESERLSRLSENLLKLASLDSEHHPYHPQPIMLDEQLRRCVVACEPLWSGKRLELELDLPPVQIVADEDSLNQVWMNLLHNAIKFTPSGGKIGIRLTTDERQVIVAVSDTGIGIAPEEQPHIFRRFYKTDASRQSGDGSGNGLGLAIVKKIVDMHGGSIVISSQKNEGAIFVVYLPGVRF
ncbi:MAG: hypothetical protein K0Q59_2280 [Paenibacillus sp.]|nr:hypothetical protein [Paenibacillus sp.]